MKIEMFSGARGHSSSLPVLFTSHVTMDIQKERERRADWVCR